MKKYKHEIKINFDQYGKLGDKIDINEVYDIIYSREFIYLNQAFISKK